MIGEGGKKRFQNNAKAAEECSPAQNTKHNQRQFELVTIMTKENVVPNIKKRFYLFYSAGIGGVITDQ